MNSISAAIPAQPAATSPAHAKLRRERRFFSGMAIAMTVACFAGFAPSYYLKAHFGTPAIKPLVHVHGMIFTLWMALLVVQTSLVAAGRVRLHRQLGIAGAVLAVLMVVSAAAVVFVRGSTVSPGMPHETLLGFLAIPTVALVFFPLLFGAALYFRRDTGTHKRLIMLSTTLFLTAAIHRLLMWTIDPAVGPLMFYGATDLFIVALVGYDLFSRGRVHAATLWGGLAVVVAQAASLILAGSKMWMTFAHWITGT
jgi:hypothetical protein